MGKHRKKSKRGQSDHAVVPFHQPQMVVDPGRKVKKNKKRRDSTSSSSSSSCSSSSTDMNRDKNLHRGATLLYKIPKVRLQQCAEAACKKLDSTLTAKCDNNDLARLIWLVTGTPPNIKISWLRAKTYKQVSQKMKKAGKRVKQLNVERWDKLVLELTTDSSSEGIARVAAREGFDASWLSSMGRETPKKPRKVGIEPAPAQDDDAGPPPTGALPKPAPDRNGVAEPSTMAVSHAVVKPPRGSDDGSGSSNNSSVSDDAESESDTPEGGNEADRTAGSSDERPLLPPAIAQPHRGQVGDMGSHQSGDAPAKRRRRSSALRPEPHQQVPQQNAFAQEQLQQQMQGQQQEQLQPQQPPNALAQQQQQERLQQQLQVQQLQSPPSPQRTTVAPTTTTTVAAAGTTVAPTATTTVAAAGTAGAAPHQHLPQQPPPPPQQLQQQQLPQQQEQQEQQQQQQQQQLLQEQGQAQQPLPQQQQQEISEEAKARIARNREAALERKRRKMVAQTEVVQEESRSHVEKKEAEEPNPGDLAPASSNGSSGSRGSSASNNAHQAAPEEAGPPEAALEAAPVTDGPTICTICREPLGESAAHNMALPCSHVFHTECITRWRNMIGRPIDKSCPFKCDVSWDALPDLPAEEEAVEEEAVEPVQAATSVQLQTVLSVDAELASVFG